MPHLVLQNTRTLFRTLFVAALIAVFWLALQPAPDIVKLVSWQDKIEHAILFAVLMALGALAWPRHLLTVAAGLLAYGAAMEVAQSFTGYRVGDVWDWVADALGVAAMAFPARHWLTRRAARTPNSARTQA
ncbi:MAG: VanZ family protein [Azoarcus sp.]|nr:VanZ family protein [Azoarcus sp.]PKO56706.1 MAG: hypothetical protein CVU28_01955 [Betaproteobacteria bacterium HGW-Betaproteobacteria-21]